MSVWVEVDTVQRSLDGFYHSLSFSCRRVSASSANVYQKNCYRDD